MVLDEKEALGREYDPKQTYEQVDCLSSREQFVPRRAVIVMQEF